MNRVLCVCGLTIALATLTGLPLASADFVTVVSDEFSFGLSASIEDSSNCWTLQAPSTSFTQGDFALTPRTTGTYFSGTGPTFPNRVLTGGAAGGFSGDGTALSLPLAASYTGTLPGDASNVQLKIELTQLNIWGLGNVGGSNSMALHEATPDHSQASSPITLVGPSTDGSWWLQLGEQQFWSQLTWDPDDYFVAVDTPNSEVTRTFNLGSISTVAVDGIDIVGRVHLSYEGSPIPEPSSIVLLIAGSISLLAYAWKKRN